MSNSNLTKEIRADYTGKLVTRTVKVDTGTKTAKSLPSPVLASKSEAALEEDYRLMHKAPYRDDEGYYPSIDNIAQMMGEDVYTHPEWFTDVVPDPEALATLRAVRGNPDAVVPIYRSVPKGVTGINAGDWVSTSKVYAEAHGHGIEKSGEFDLLVAHVPASTLFTEGNSLEEFGYDGDAIETKKKHYKDMTDDEKREYIPDLYQRSDSVRTIMDEAFRKSPTIDTQKALFAQHKDIIHESMDYALHAFETSARVPGRDFDYYINERLSEEYERPEEIGGIRLRLVANGKDRTIELYGDEPEPGRDTDITSLMRDAIKKLRIKTDYDLTRLVDAAETSALTNGAGCSGRYDYDNTREDIDLRYAEVTFLPSRREEFVKEHGGVRSVADGWI